MLNTLRLIEVEKMAIDADDLNMTATNLPVGSHTMLFGNPPIIRWPHLIALKSAIGNDCFDAAATEKKIIEN